MKILQYHKLYPKETNHERTKQLDINLQDPTEAVMLLGISDKNVKLIEAELKVQLITRGELIQIIGEEKM